ncbi:MAG: hypothetical protein JRF63_15600 [Deltaproteobacteria bacterium]|nr:hypothetical protein [Deltaproteobacteria bacterium]
MLRAILISCLALVATTSGCSGKEPQVGAVVAAAGTLQAIQLAREQNPANQPTAGECCMLCGPCEFPCGDYCVPFGTLCPEATGCACARLPKGTTGDPVPEEQHKPECDQRMMLPLPGAD